MEAFFGELSVGLIQVIVPIILTAFSLILTWITFELKRFITSKINSAKVKESLDIIDGIVGDVVKDLEQSVRKAYGDGKLDDSEKAELLALAQDKVKTQLPRIVDELGKLGVGSLEGLITTKIQSAVYTMNQTK